MRETIFVCCVLLGYYYFNVRFVCVYLSVFDLFFMDKQTDNLSIASTVSMKSVAYHASIASFKSCPEGDLLQYWLGIYPDRILSIQQNSVDFVMWLFQNGLAEP